MWDSYYYQAAIHDAKVNFNHDHGITIINKQDHYIEYVDIAAPKNHREMTSFYLNNFDQIENFITDFITKSANLIVMANKRLVKLPEVLCLPTDSQNQASIKNYKISNREKQCLEFYLAGNTAKETAEILQLSHRTIEDYFNKIKKKLNCINKRELLKKFNKNPVV